MRGTGKHESGVALSGKMEVNGWLQRKPRKRRGGPFLVATRRCPGRYRRFMASANSPVYIHERRFTVRTAWAATILGAI